MEISKRNYFNELLVIISRNVLTRSGKGNTEMVLEFNLAGQLAKTTTNAFTSLPQSFVDLSEDYREFKFTGQLQDFPTVTMIKTQFLTNNLLTSDFVPLNN